MGSIKKIRKKYSKPKHPWRKARIDEENAICKEYGIPKKIELWKAISKLESFKNQAKSISTVNVGQTERQNTIQKDQLLKRLERYNLVTGHELDDVLSITLKNLLERRLQTLVYRKHFAKSMMQARQLIVQRHILVNSKILTSPSYLVRTSEESTIEISPKSPFYDTNHAERVKEPSKRVRKVPDKKDRRRP